MPCISYEDYSPEPSPFQKDVANVVRHLLFICDKMGNTPREELNKAYTKSLFSKEEGDKWVAHLCGVITDMTPSDRERIVFDGHSKKSRKLADWWENHQEQDRIAAAQERARLEKAEYQQALKKLSSLEPEDITRFLEDNSY